MISVIIPTRNRAELLTLALGSFTKQILDSALFEILVIDNGSTDCTAGVVNRFCDILPNLKYHHESEPGLHAGRHRGLRESQGDILVFTDDDIEALPEWLKSISEAFEDPEVAMVGGNNLPMFLEQPPSWLLRLWESSEFGEGKAFSPLSILELLTGKRFFSPYYVWGCNFAIRKSVLLQAGGFHPDGVPKELIKFRGDGETHVARFVEKSAKKCLFHPGASVYHKVTPERMTLEYMYQRSFNQGISDSYAELRDEYFHGITVRNKTNKLNKMIRWAYRKVKIMSQRDVEIKKVTIEMGKGYADGYTFHQKAFKTDPEVREWVLKESYL